MKSSNQPRIIINHDKTFDGVDHLLIIDALQVRKEQKSKDIYQNQLPLVAKIGPISPDGFF